MAEVGQLFTLERNIVNELVRNVVIVSDGIMVEFGTGECCYYPATFLLDNLLREPNHIFLNYDPREEANTETLVGFPAVGTVAIRSKAVQIS